MKRILYLFVAILACHTAQGQIVIPREEVHYNVSYRWGLIDVMIARGVVTAECDGTRFYGTLDGTSIPWEGKIICVSDTLSADMYGFRENVAYQSGWYRHVPVSLFRSGTYDPADPAYYRNIAGRGAYDASNDSMEAITVTSDMLGMFFYSRLIDFNALRPGERVTVSIEGPYSRELVVTYQGQDIYSAGGDNYPVYNCQFEYSYAGSMSGYPVECKIAERSRIPLYFSASLPVGRVEMLYAD